MSFQWDRRYAQRIQGMGSSIIRELLKFTQQPDIISFAGGLPAGELFPIDHFRQAADRVLKEQGELALQYSTTEGYLPLRQLIAERFSRFGVQVTAENVLITSGSQQGLDIIGKVMIDPGDLILTEEPTYLGALQAWRAYQAEYITVPIDDDGIVLDERLQDALRSGPKMMYILPSFQNPGGVTLSLERRKKLLETAAHFGIPIIEDDPYGDLVFEGEPLPPLLALDAQTNVPDNGKDPLANGKVLYLGTFSKTLAPGFRLGWIVGPQEVVRKCVMAKQGMDLHTSTFSQMVAYEAAKDGFLDRHGALIRKVYGERRDVMLQALADYMPDGVTWTHPNGGLFLWVKVPPVVDTMELLQTAVAHKVAFVPGIAFYPPGPLQENGRHAMRLNFSNARPELIQEGIKRLGSAIKAALKENTASISL